jgi:hypothetical protein
MRAKKVLADVAALRRARARIHSHTRVDLGDACSTLDHNLPTPTHTSTRVHMCLAVRMSMVIN